jgi:hypothetical protein
MVDVPCNKLTLLQQRSSEQKLITSSWRESHLKFLKFFFFLRKFVFEAFRDVCHARVGKLLNRFNLRATPAQLLCIDSSMKACIHRACDSVHYLNNARIFFSHFKTHANTHTMIMQVFQPVHLDECHH